MGSTFTGAALGALLVLALVPAAKPQDATALAQFFEAKQVIVKMDMPGTQQGVDIYPGRPQPLDLKSYSGRLKKFGIAIRNGDSVMVTKVKVKNNNVEFQLAGGGYGTFGDDTDTSVHYTPSEKSRREKDLENQINAEKDPDRRRSLQRELDRVRRDRERSDNIARSVAQDAAESKKVRVDAKRTQGGSRFNLHFDTKTVGDSLTPQMVMNALASYVTFPPETFGAANGAAPESRPTLPPSPPAR